MALLIVGPDVPYGPEEGASSSGGVLVGGGAVIGWVLGWVIGIDTQPKGKQRETQIKTL